MCLQFYPLLPLRWKVQAEKPLETCGPAGLGCAVVNERPYLKGEGGDDT